MKKVISRFQEGVSLNPKEYVLDTNNQVIEFDNEESAKKFLVDQGFTEEDFGEDGWIFIEDAEEV